MALAEDYTIEQIPHSMAQEIIVAKHYLHRKAPCSYAFGMFDSSGQIVGVVIYGVPASSTLLKGICGPDEAQNVYELTRLWVDDDVAKNGESFLIGNTLKLLDREIVVSFADSSRNHVGYVYQATNWLYTGLSAAHKDYAIRGMEELHSRSISRMGKSLSEIKEIYGDNFYYRQRPRKHRYIYFNASKTRRKSLERKLRYKIQPYPKAATIETGRPR